MNVLIITFMFPCQRHPTSAIFFANLIKELAPKLDGLTIITPRIYVPKMLTKLKPRWKKWYIDPMVSQEDGIEIIRPYFISLRGASYEGINGIFMQYSIVNLVRKIIYDKNIDMILGYNMLPEGVAAVKLGKMFNLPCGFWAIGTDVNDIANCNWFNRYYSRKCIEESSVVFCESKDLERKVRSFTAKHIRAETFYKGIDISNFQSTLSRDSLLDKFNLSNKQRYILFVGRLIYDKGIYELARAFHVIANKYPDIRLILIGEEIEKAKLSGILNDLGLQDKVIFRGIIPYKEIAYFMKISEMLVLPTWAEGLPNVIMEAMISGLPVIATDVGGIPEILEDGKTGLSVPAQKVGPLADAIIKMIENQELRQDCIRNAKKMILENFDVKKNATKLYEILEDVKLRHIRDS